MKSMECSRLVNLRWSKEANDRMANQSQFALKVEEKVPKEAVVKKGHSKGKALVSKFDNKLSNSDDD